jgi:hypothetical protein
MRGAKTEPPESLGSWGLVLDGFLAGLRQVSKWQAPAVSGMGHGQSVDHKSDAPVIVKVTCNKLRSDLDEFGLGLLAGGAFGIPLFFE